jgi:NAD(P)-dependent dehydrogenase (short-subunit alcohol dehydrogenase family)
MDLYLAGKTAVVTGASKGIGLAVTKALVEAGAHVVAGSRTRGDQPPALEETGQVSFVSVDLSQPDAAEELVAAAAPSSSSARSTRTCPSSRSTITAPPKPP